MNEITCILADDEPIARQILEKYIADVPHLQLLHSCSDAFEVMEFLQKRSVDLLFLDINMPKLTGLALLKSMSHPLPDVIITTAYPNYAVEGFELSVTDYLLKPFSFERFLKAVMKVQGQHEEKQTVLTATAPEVKDSIFVKSDKKLIKLRFDEINFLEAYGNFIKINTEKTILISETLTSFSQKLPPHFIRTHKSYCANIDRITMIDGNQIFFPNGTQIPISASYRKHVLDSIQSR